MSDESPRRSRRMFIGDVIGVGAAVVASVAWGWGTRTPAAGQSPTPNRPTPAETDHQRNAGDMVAPLPSSSPTGAHKCPSTPCELDHIMPPGGIAPPPATPRPSASPKKKS